MTMRNKILIHKNKEIVSNTLRNFTIDERFNSQSTIGTLPEILFISSYPPRECGIATYTQDLIKALNNQFSNSFAIKICALATETEKHIYPKEVEYILETDETKSYRKLAEDINSNADIQLVLIQHEFGLFSTNEEDFRNFINALIKPVMFVFHTILPNPNEALKLNVQQLSKIAESLVVMTQSSLDILVRDYGISKSKIAVIGHGTHLVEHTDKNILKEKYQLSGKKVLSTFGLLSSGKSIETTLDALPEIIKDNADTMFLIIGKTHPSVVKNEGEAYRDMLKLKIETLHLQNHVRFVNHFLTLPELLEYLQLTDIYLFTSKDPNQAVSGTFSYALSCGCPIISTPIPHAKEVLQNDTGFLFDFGNSKQLAKQVNRLLANDELRHNTSTKALHTMVPNAWENSALAHAVLFDKFSDSPMHLKYKTPEINLNHFKKMTTKFGMIQFSIINHPDIDSGYTIDDNARAMIAMCQHLELTGDVKNIEYIGRYLNFIQYCLRPDGYFLNYVDENYQFTEQNNQTNLADSNGRAIWALGYLLSIGDQLPVDMVLKADKIMTQALANADKVFSTRAMAFIIKGIYYRNLKRSIPQHINLLKSLADRMVQMYRHESKGTWKWFENYLTYANSVLPEAMLFAFSATGNMVYKEIAQTSFDFLLSKIYREDTIKVISNKGWMQFGEQVVPEKIGGEQPIDVAYTILALANFYEEFHETDYLKKMKIAFNWFLGKNHLNQIIYNPCTGGCFDGLEDVHVNLNQGAESTVSYLMARLTIEKYFAAVQSHPFKIADQQKVHYFRPANYYQISAT